MSSDEGQREATTAELQAAEALRLALDGEGATGDAEDLARLAGRLRATAGIAEPLEPARRDAAVDAALAGASRRRFGRWAVALVAAAVAVLVLGLLVPLSRQSTSAELPAEAYASATDELFEGPFPDEQSPAARVDTILAARTRGYFAGLAAGR